MAGMLAARVLSNHFDQVSIIERDQYPDAAASRRGVPQARHLHVLLERGRLILEQLFPGLSAEMVADGAHMVDTAADFALLNPAGWAVQFPSGIRMLACSRDLVDWHVRRRLRMNPRVRFVPEMDVAGIVPDESRTGIAGVAVRSRAVDRTKPALANEREATIFGDLVVDASGRGSRAPKWLESLGYPRVDETVVNAFLGYASRFYRCPAGLPGGCKGLFLQAAPPKNNRAGVAFPIEGDRWIVTVSGGARDYPAGDESEFLNFVRSLRSPVLYEAIKDAEPLSPIFLHRGGENRVRHFDRMSRWPERFVVLGDAVCTFNPVYAQGMTAAALSAMSLDACLLRQRSWHPHGSLTGLARRFQASVARIVAVPWMFATTEDLRYSTTESAHSLWTDRLMHRYIDHVLRLSTTSPTVRRRSLSVFHMLNSPATLFHPGTLARVLWDAIRLSA
jgi:2-polyprenyl-6-methoxyphenol hydroxylase-like FAD-dependent oxidoreductase